MSESVTANQIPPDAKQISTQDLFAIIGELTVQVRVLQRMLSEQSRQIVALNNGVTNEPIPT